MELKRTQSAASEPVRASIRKPARSKSAAARILLVILVVIAAGGVAAWYFLIKTPQASSQAGTGSTTTTETVTRGDIILTASGSGTLVSNQSVNMAFSTSGKVAELNVKLGDMVKAGDVLARLEKAQDLEASLASAQANLLQAQQDLATLQKKAGSTLAQAYQTMITAQATYDDALAASQRVTSTRCTQETVNKYWAALEGATQTLNDAFKKDASSDASASANTAYQMALANYNYCASFTSTEKSSAQSSLEVAKSALQDAKDKYNSLKDASGIDPDTLAKDETRVETAQTQVNTAQEALDGITLKSPIDGKITYLAASIGAIVDTSTFLTIADVSKPAVTVSLDETDMDKLVVGNSAVITFTALPGKTFTGKVSLANPQMVTFGPFRAASGQVELDAESAKAVESLPLGLSATVKITGKEAKNALILPVSALKQQSNGDYVVKLVGSDGTLADQVVTVGIRDSSSAEITGGLKEGDVVSITTAASTSKNTNRQQSGQFIEGGEPPTR